MNYPGQSLKLWFDINYLFSICSTKVPFQKFVLNIMFALLKFFLGLLKHSFRNFLVKSQRSLVVIHLTACQFNRFLHEFLIFWLVQIWKEDLALIFLFTTTYFLPITSTVHFNCIRQHFFVSEQFDDHQCWRIVRKVKKSKSQVTISHPR